MVVCYGRAWSKRILKLYSENTGALCFYNKIIQQLKNEETVPDGLINIAHLHIPPPFLHCGLRIAHKLHIAQSEMAMQDSLPRFRFLTSH